MVCYMENKDDKIVPVNNEVIKIAEELPKYRRKKTIRDFIKVVRMIFKRIFPTYSYWWTNSKEDYDAIENDGFYQIIIRQDCVKANTIDLGQFEIDFPWHGHTYADFERLSNRYKACMKRYKLDGGKKTAIAIKRWYPDVYQAFFEHPIIVDKDTRRINDGRHRVFVLEKIGMEIPVWIVEWKMGRDITFEEYHNNDTIGEWRF